jgi:hypothetical protein
MLAILAAWELGIVRIMVQDQPGQKISQDPISTNKKLGVVNYTCHHSCEGSLNRLGEWFKLYNTCLESVMLS